MVRRAPARLLLLLPLVLGVAVAAGEVDSRASLTAGIEAARSGNLEGLRTALRVGVELDGREDGSGQTMLMAACLAGQANAVKYLLSKGADWRVGEKDGYTPMHGAAFQGRDLVAAALLEAGVPADGGDLHPDGYPPVFRAVWGQRTGHLKVIKLLVGGGHVDINVLDAAGKSLLDHALERSNHRAARYLVHAGIDTSGHDPEVLRASKHHEL
mmetsp:Transcript_47350/g.119863  ORF Transcript_47350/g.119863 Transcript_47350/m.119863 type:complete len:213 (+) Transcript_47350:177-815(+)